MRRLNPKIEVQECSSIVQFQIINNTVVVAVVAVVIKAAIFCLNFILFLIVVITSCGHTV